MFQFILVFSGRREFIIIIIIIIIGGPSNSEVNISSYPGTDVAGLFFFCRAEKELLIVLKRRFFGVVQKYYHPATMHSWIPVQGHF